jgi:hypothetical protein
VTRPRLGDVVSAVRLALLVPFVLLAAACGSAHNSAQPGVAKLLVGQTVNPGGGMPIEGAYSYVRVEDRSGGKVAERRVQSDRNVEIPLDPGSYELVSYQRTCDGNCGTLDPASDSCSESFTADGTVTARVRVTYGAGCTITFATK